MPILDALLKTGLKGVTDSVGGLVDKFVTTDQERLQMKQELLNVVVDYGDAQLKAQSEVLTTEMQGNWLQKSWRPILMLAFGFIIIYEYFISKVFNLPTVALPENFWNLLELGMGGYVIGRSAEKITQAVTSNLDKIPSRKNN